MVQQEVLGPLADLLAVYRESWSPATTDLGQEVPRDADPVSNTFVHAAHLLWNLWWVRSCLFVPFFSPVSFQWCLYKVFPVFLSMKSSSCLSTLLYCFLDSSYLCGFESFQSLFPCGILM